MADKNPYLVGKLVGEEGDAVERALERSRALPSAKLYQNARSYLSRQQRERLLKHVIPKVLREGRAIHERGTPTPLRELRGYKVGDEWDLEATLDQRLAFGDTRLDYAAIRTRKKKEAKRAFVILADQSNSLSKYMHYVALTTAMLCFALKAEHLSVIGFQSDTCVLKGMREVVPVDLLMSRILDLECGGATDLYRPLVDARKELASVGSGIQQHVILISDCAPTVGRNSLPVAKGLPRLHILYLPPVTFGECCLIGQLSRYDNTRIYEVKRFEDIIDHVRVIVSSDEVA
ncbi:MAG: VWA domain-containing protein [Actinobacteria bacterium]|nr:VWA domain-containing protein [Actinomycetota bacterium]MCL5736769.1 VWA domain-containing protein [Actinomycetota bacterium]